MLAGCFSCALFLITFQAFSIGFKYGKLSGHSQMGISLSWSIFTSLDLWAESTIMQEVAALMDVADGQHMLLRNLQIVGSI